MSAELTWCQMVGGGPDGTHNGSDGDTFLVNLWELVQSRKPQTLWS